MSERLQIGSILVPVDGSECSRFAVEHAVKIAAEYGAQIVFLHVVDEVVLAALSGHGAADEAALVRERLFAQGSSFLGDAMRVASAHVDCRQQVQEGDPCAVVCDLAGKLGADLIVMGKTGHRGTRRILMGSVTRRVIESSDAPVLVVAHQPCRPHDRKRG